jgi:hypothetical protein
MKMKKTPFLIALVLISAVLFSSCLSNNSRTYKKNLAEQPDIIYSAVITFDGSGTEFVIKKWNGDNIPGIRVGQRPFTKNVKAELTVPAGDNRFTFDLTFSFHLGHVTYTAQNIELQYFLAAGQRYTVKARYNTIGTGLNPQREFFIAIYSDTDGELLKEWKLGQS